MPSVPPHITTSNFAVPGRGEDTSWTNWGAEPSHLHEHLADFKALACMVRNVNGLGSSSTGTALSSSCMQ